MHGPVQVKKTSGSNTISCHHVTVNEMGLAVDATNSKQDTGRAADDIEVSRKTESSVSPQASLPGTLERVTVKEIGGSPKEHVFMDEDVKEDGNQDAIFTSEVVATQRSESLVNTSQIQAAQTSLLNNNSYQDNEQQKTVDRSLAEVIGKRHILRKQSQRLAADATDQPNTDTYCADDQDKQAGHLCEDIAKKNVKVTSIVQAFCQSKSTHVPNHAKGNMMPSRCISWQYNCIILSMSVVGNLLHAVSQDLSHTVSAFMKLLEMLKSKGLSTHAFAQACLDSCQD